MCHRQLSYLARAAALLGLFLGFLLLDSAPALACSEDFIEEVTLDDLDEQRIVAIGQAEIVARTGATWRWHRAGVVAFVQAWPLSDDLDAVPEAVWTRNSRRNNGGDCYFGRDAGDVGASEGFHVLLDDGAVIQIRYLNEDSDTWVDAAELTSRFGQPTSVTPDPELVEAALSALIAERRVEYWLVRSVALFAAFGVIALYFFVFRARLRAASRLLRSTG